MRSRKRLDDLEARIAALEEARPTVELVAWSKVPDAEPVDAQRPVARPLRRRVRPRLRR